MRSDFIHGLAAGVMGGAFLIAVPAAFAVPTTYTFQETSSSPSGFEPSATITINGTFADLPTVTNVLDFNVGNPGPYDFGNLLALSLEYSNPGGPVPIVKFSLSNFVPPLFLGTHGGVPTWSISPTGIDFAGDGFLNFFSFAFSPDASVDVLNFEGSILCSHSFGCVAHGDWISIPVPEPSSVSLLLMGLGVIGAAYYWRKKHY